MKTAFLGFLVIGFLFTASGIQIKADDAKEQAIKKERKKIAGTWRAAAIEMDGNKVPEEDVKKISVVNRADGTWSRLIDGNENGKGTSTIDPTKKIKTIDFTITEGEGNGDTFLGIYELSKDTLRVCFAKSGKDRPTEFSSQPGSGHTLVTFERVKGK